MTPISVQPAAEVAPSIQGFALARENNLRKTPPETKPATAPQEESAPVVSEEAKTKDSTPDLEVVLEAVNRLQAATDLLNRDLHFQVAGPDDLIQVQVIDIQKEEVIREIPSQEAIETAERISEALGLILDTEA